MATTRRSTARKATGSASRTSRSTSSVNARSFAQAQTAWKKAEAQVKELRAQQQELARAFAAQTQLIREFVRRFSTQANAGWTTGSSKSASRKTTRKPASKSRVATRGFTVISGAKRSFRAA